MSRKRFGLAALAATAFFGTAHAQDLPPSAPSAIQIEAGRSDHLTRPDSDTASFSLDLNGWDLGLSYANEAPEFADERKRITLSAAKQFDNNQFSLSLRNRDGGLANESGVYAGWTHGLTGGRQFGAEGAFTNRDLSEFQIQDGSQAHLRLFYRMPKGVTFSVFANQNATTDLINGKDGFAALPRTSLLGRQTIADVNVGEDVVEDAIGASVAFNGSTRAWSAYAKQGEQRLRATPQSDKFTAFGGSARVKGQHLFGGIELDVRSASDIFAEYSEARVALDGGVRANRFELGMAAYSRGISSELDAALLTDFYQSAGGALNVAARFGEKTWVGLWAMMEDDAPNYHRVMRAGPYVRFGEYEVGVGARQDRDGMSRFFTETAGYFATFKSPFGDALIGMQDGEAYGNLSVRLNKRDVSTEALPFMAKDSTHSFLPNASRYAIDPFTGSNVDVEWGTGAHTGKLFTRTSEMRDHDERTFLSSKEFGGSYRFSAGRINADIVAALREIPELDFSAPTARAALMYDFDRFSIGAGIVRDYPDFIQSRDAQFAFTRVPLGEHLRLENALGMQDGGIFTSFMLSIPTTGTPERGLLPYQLLPPVVRNAVMNAALAGMPGPVDLTVNVGNCDGCGEQQLPYLQQHRNAIQGVRISPVAFARCREGDELTDRCTTVPPRSDTFINGVLDLFGDNNIFLVDLDLNSRPVKQIPLPALYQMVTSIARYDPRVRLIQCLNESQNSGDHSVQDYAANALQVCRQAIADVNRERPPGREAFLIDSAPVGLTSGITEKWALYTKTNARELVDMVSCHLYGKSLDDFTRMAEECKAIARDKPLMFTEVNVTASGSDLHGNGGSSYDKHRWVVETVMPAIEKIARRNVPADRQWMVKNVFYSLASHADGQFNIIGFTNHWDPSSWYGTSDLQQLIEAREQYVTGAPAAAVLAAQPSAVSVPAAKTLYERTQGRFRKVEPQ